MDDFSHLNVFEPLDTNSLSIISTASSNNNTNTRCQTGQNGSFKNSPVDDSFMPSIANRNENVAPFKWNTEKNEFKFESNSTPSKKTPRGKSFSHSHLLLPRKRRSQLIGAKPNVPSKLYQSTSKLELIDDDKLTSLPIAPPPGWNSDEDNDENYNTDGNMVKKQKFNPRGELRVHNNNMKRYVSYNIQKVQESSENGDVLQDNTAPSIVVVEDYIPEVMGRGTTKKKVSVSDLKSKMLRKDSHRIPLKMKRIKNDSTYTYPSKSILLTPHAFNEEYSLNGSILEEGRQEGDLKISDSIQDMVDDLIKQPSEFAGEDKYLADLPIKHPIKTCVVCDKVLYEISSILIGHNDYKEIVCGDCAVKYEQAAKIFENCEFETSAENSNNTSMMSSLDSPVEPFIDKNWDLSVNKANSINKREKIKQDYKFSDELIRTLKSQLSHSLPYQNTLDNTGSLTWFLKAKQKILLQVQKSGLFPLFINRQNEVSYDEQKSNR
ncbi:uncharacterized protein NDAI_0A06850 [Naumovozyma dairenensis CBS 421]|uniref:Uncharacterized protein n=1 Tax=Naumovozyma dairenensis (strain ATCC 10597 / BCRC 20456 / CBS 421 / NBRC 0211 / NRRL Y-12639) TaxID=1071378 RepID=G0W4V1_NAUDC|nr:hypothetical protein NDAI_0A06850 [Naumovozyma dairenensis CBS 421]CCD22839.1 hypothetical protein NDAI_0A06850 [Naumovozyma dairenensis CBS 421]